MYTLFLSVNSENSKDFTSLFKFEKKLAFLCISQNGLLQANEILFSHKIYRKMYPTQGPTCKPKKKTLLLTIQQQFFILNQQSGKKTP